MKILLIRQIRKSNFSHTIQQYVTKFPSSVLSGGVPATYILELDYSEYLDEALHDAYELREQLALNETLDRNQRVWYILKVALAERGYGIRLFSTMHELEQIFLEWEPSNDKGSDSGNDKEEENDDDDGGDGDGVAVNQMRQFVVQEYMTHPMLVDNKKFHLRVYVVTSGALKIWVYTGILALFAKDTYMHPSEDISLLRHLTNTCFGYKKSVAQPFVTTLDLLPLESHLKLKIREQINSLVVDLFKAALGQPTQFQPLPNAFEIYGLDFLPCETGELKLLEVNAYPDFKQSGEDLGDVISGLFERVVQNVVAPYFNVSEPAAKQEDFELVLDENMHHF